MKTRTKICSCCGEKKSLGEFYKQNDRKIGVRSQCKICSKKNYATTNEKHQEALLKYRFGINLEQYNKTLKLQNGVCAICKCVDSTGRRLAVDHDHKTGKIRGLLCNRCNVQLIGLDDKVYFKLALQYLNKYDSSE